MKHINYLPLFCDMTGKEVLVFGAGKIAARRVEVLLSFGAAVTLAAPEFAPEMEELVRRFFVPEGERTDRAEHVSKAGKIREIKRCAYRPGSIPEEMDYVLAVTDDPAVNEAIYRECRHREIPVNVASDQTKCDFYFPAVIESEDVIIGVTSGGRNHKKVREIAQRIREMLE